MSVNIISFTLDTTDKYYTKEIVTLDFLKKFINKVEPALSCKIHESYEEDWLEVEGLEVANVNFVGSLVTESPMLNVERVEEIVL